MKKLHIGFAIAAIVVLAAGLIHGGVAWLVASLTWDPMENSFPTWSMFVIVFLCYLAAVIAILILWLIAWLIVRAIKKRRLPSA